MARQEIAKATFVDEMLLCESAEKLAHFHGNQQASQARTLRLSKTSHLIPLWMTSRCVSLHDRGFLLGGLSYELVCAGKEGRQKRARFNEEQIISILKEAEAGAMVTGTVPAPRDLGRDLLYLAQQVRRAGGLGDAPVAPARRREPAAEGDRGRPGARPPRTAFEESRCLCPAELLCQPGSGSLPNVHSRCMLGIERCRQKTLLAA